MQKYLLDLQRAKPHDEVQYIEAHAFREAPYTYNFITTAGHGYLVVPLGDFYAPIARRLCSYGYKGKLAYYLEEDSEAPAFEKYITDSYKKADKEGRIITNS